MMRHLCCSATAGVLAALLVTPSVAAAQLDVKQIYPAPSTTGGANVIVVISDGYTDETQFDVDASFIFVTRLMNDAFYSSHGASFTIKTGYAAAPAEGVSSFGISTANRASCDLAPNRAATRTKIFDAAAEADANWKFAVVLAYDSVSYACYTNDSWTYVTAGASDRNGIVAHELGHQIGGLFDEWDDGVSPYSGGEVNHSNCSTHLPPQTPHWMATGYTQGASTPTNPMGCLYSVSGIVRPYESCKMRNYDRGQPFCAVCVREMEAVLSPPPPSEAPTPTPPTNLKVIKAAFRAQPTAAPPRGVRLLVNVDVSTGKTEVVAANDVQNPQIVQRRIGDVVFAIIVNGEPIATGVLPGDPFQSRVYNGGPRHSTIEGKEATVQVIVPRASVDLLIASPVQIAFYKLSGSDPEAVTPAKLKSLIEADKTTRLAVVAPGALSASLKALRSR